MAGSEAPQSVESMTLRVPFTAVPEAAVGDSVAVRVPEAPAASCSGVVVLPPVLTIVDVDVGRPLSVGTGLIWLYATVPVTLFENTVPSVVAPCITSISHRPGWGSGVISDAFPVGLSGVGVASVA